MADFSKQALAAAWATRNMSAQDWNNWCLKFVANAYGREAAGYNTAAEAAGALGVQARPQNGMTAEQKKAILDRAKIGDLVFYDATYDNSAGHVGVYVGNGRMVAAEPDGVRESDVLGSAYNSSRFRGIAPPPKEWQGRQTTQDLIDGAKKFQSVIESTSMASEKTLALKAQRDGQETRINKLEEEAKNLQTALASKDKKVASDAALRLQQINTELKDVRPAYDKSKIDYAASVDDDTAKAAKTTTVEQHKGGDGSLWEKNASGQWVQTIAPQGAPTITKAPDGSLIQYDEKTSSWKKIADAPAPERKTSWQDTGRELVLMDDGGKVIQTLQKQQGVSYTQRQDGSLWITDPTGGTAPRQVAAPVEKYRTPEEVITDKAGATRAQNLTEKEAIELTELRRQQDSGELTAGNQARLQELQARAQSTTATAERTTRISGQGGLLDQTDEAQLAQTRANTPTDVEVKARGEVATARAAQENLKAAYNKKEADVAALVANGTLTQEEALAHLGKYAESLQAQLETRRQQELERHQREQEQLARDTENRSLAELAAEQISNAQGTAIFRGRGDNYGDPNRAATKFNPGGDPNQSPAQRVLASLGLSQKPYENKPSTFQPLQIKPMAAAAPTTAVPTGQGIGTQVPLAPVAPAFDYSAAQAGLNERVAAGAPSGIGLPLPVPLSFFNGGV